MSIPTLPRFSGAPCAVLLAFALLVCGQPAPAQAESVAAARLRAIAQQLSAKNANATQEEKAATRSFAESLAASGPASESTGKAALELGQVALGEGRPAEARSLADAVLAVAGSLNSAAAQGDSSLVANAKTLINAAVSVQQAYAAGSAPQSASILYSDLDSFDRKLSTRLDAKPEKLDVLFPTPVSVSKLPERVDKWLSAVEDSGGTVETKVIPTQGRGFLGDIINIILSAYEAYKNRTLYVPASKYNAVVYYEPEAGTLTKVTFSLRNAAK